MTLKRPSYNLRPITRHNGSTMPMIPVSDGLPIRSCNELIVLHVTIILLYENCLQPTFQTNTGILKGTNFSVNTSHVI